MGGRKPRGRCWPFHAEFALVGRVDRPRGKGVMLCVTGATALPLPRYPDGKPSSQVAPSSQLCPVFPAPCKSAVCHLDSEKAADSVPVSLHSVAPLC